MYEIDIHQQKRLSNVMLKPICDTPVSFATKYTCMYSSYMKEEKNR